MVSDIDEDQNDNANESNENAKQGANFDILQQILNEQSATKCDLEEENLMDADEPEEEGNCDEEPPRMKSGTPVKSKCYTNPCSLHPILIMHLMF